MAQRLLIIYRAVQTPPQTIIVSTDNGFFQGSAGKWDQVCRVDYFDEGVLAAVVACDPANSIVTVDGGGDFVDIGLTFFYLLGTPKPLGGFKAGMAATLKFQSGNLVFSQGMLLDGRPVTADDGSVINAYSGVFLQLGKLNATARSVDSSALSSLPDSWPTFPFGPSLFYCVRALPMSGQAQPVPIFTHEREIPALHNSVLRRLPAPFVISTALDAPGSPGVPPIRAVATPNSDWVSTPQGAVPNWIVDVSHFQPGTIAEFWQYAVIDRYIGALLSVSGAEVVSMLPNFSGTLNDGDWRLQLPVPSTIGGVSLQLLGPLGSAAPSTDPVEMICDGFQTHAGSGLSFSAGLGDLPFPADELPTAPWVRFNLSGVTFENGDAGSKVRLGSLDLSFKNPDATAQWMTCAISFEQITSEFWLPRVNLSSPGMPLSDLTPGGQDDPDDPILDELLAALQAAGNPANRLPLGQLYAREPALVVPVALPQTMDTATSAILNVNLAESSVKGQNQQFTFTVESQSAGNADGTNLLVIDRHPFTVAYVQLPNLAATATADTSQIAEWSNSFPEGAGWRISAGAASFGFQLPPQGIGEAMVTALASPDEPRENANIDFRLTPPTQFVVEPSGEVQRFAEPGWNIRRITGYPGERAPGVAVVSVETESVYGLSCTISTDGLNVSEMFSRLGGFAGPLVDSTTGSIVLGTGAGYTRVQKSHFDDLNDLWGGVYQQLLSRLGVLELWKQERGFDLQLSDGISYELRASAYDVNNPASFAGGVAYALLVEDLLDVVQKNPKSSSALLRNPRFSALGAYGGQRASFQYDNIIIEADYAMGLLNTLTVTVIGRIGNFWHHAKHVTVYERSVRPSRQFYQQQPRLEGRPILRKVSEYVEITQKVRSYPESGAPVWCGFVQGVEFKSVRINVDGKWATSVPGATGQRIPLWRRDAAPLDVYPRPQILIQFATDPATGNDTAPSEILDPDKLCFWGDPAQKTSNTDIWAAVAFVDYCISAPYRSIGSKPVASDYTVEPGFGRFSYSVAADASKVNVVAQRTGNAISSALRSVSFMRAQSGATLPSTVQQQAGLLHDFVNNTLDELVRAAQTATGKPVDAINQRLTSVTADLVTPFKGVCASVGGVSPTSVCATLSSAAGSAIQQAAVSVKNLWQKQLDSAQAQLLTTANTGQPTLASLKQALLADVDNAYLGIKNVVGILVYDLSVAKALSDRLNSLVQAIVKDLATFRATLSDASLAVLTFRQAAIITLNRCQGDMDATLDDVQQLLASADFLLGVRTSNLDGLVDVRTALASFCQDLAAGFSSVTQNLLDSAPLAADIEQEIDDITATLQVADLQQALATLSTSLAAIGAAANPILAYLVKLRDALQAAIANVSTTVAADYISAITQTFSQTMLGDFDIAVAQLVTTVQAQVAAACATLVNSFANTLNTVIAGFLDDTNIKDALGSLTDAADCVAALEDLRTGYIAQLDGVVQQCMDAVSTPDAAVSTGLSLMRAFGAPPEVPGLDFGGTDAIAYFYNTVTQDAQNVVYDIVQEVPVSAGLESFVTQASSALGDAANQLQQLGIGSLPTRGVLDRLVPNPDLSNLQLSDIFPNIAGLNLDNLFSGITMPSLASNNIHISHSFDPQTLRASLDVTLNFPLDDSATTLFSIGPATVTIENCIFQAAVHVAGAPGQSGSRTSSGSISGDWHVLIGGTEIITFVSTALTFDEAGHLHFDIQPARVQLAAVLQFLAEFVEGLDLGGGFTLNMLPSGIQCLLDLPFPDMSAGAFGIANLSLGCLFELDILPTFAITVGANLGEQEAPFTLTIFVLGGAGWFESSVTYTPDTGQLQADVSIGILASASLSISLGPISGGVYIYFGITAEFHTGSGLELGILLMIQGRVSLLGIIDIDLTLLLEAEYTSGGGLIGRGEVDAKIKICWCFTLEVHKSVQFTFGSSGGGSTQTHAELRTPRAAALTSRAIPAVSVPSQTYAQAASNRINFLT